jgi:hypothetical protein
MLEWKFSPAAKLEEFSTKLFPRINANEKKLHKLLIKSFKLTSPRKSKQKIQTNSFKESHQKNVHGLILSPEK